MKRYKKMSKKLTKPIKLNLNRNYIATSDTTQQIKEKNSIDMMEQFEIECIAQGRKQALEEVEKLIDKRIEICEDRLANMEMGAWSVIEENAKAWQLRELKSKIKELKK